MVNITDKAKAMLELDKEFSNVVAQSELMTKEMLQLTAEFQLKMSALSKKQEAFTERLAVIQDTMVKLNYV